MNVFKTSPDVFTAITSVTDDELKRQFKKEQLSEKMVLTEE